MIIETHSQSTAVNGKVSVYVSGSQCGQLTHVGERRVGQGTDFIVAQVTEIKHKIFYMYCH